LPFDRERAEYLMEMNIQRKFANVAKRVRAHQDDRGAVRSSSTNGGAGPAS
jgi:hypothetical protein